MQVQFVMQALTIKRSGAEYKNKEDEYIIMVIAFTGGQALLITHFN